eukprot:1381968-Ditylum_brightwellii.AAC.1
MSKKAVKNCNPAFDVFEKPVVCQDPAECYLTNYHDDASETFTTQRLSYRITTKDLDKFLDMSNAFIQMEVNVRVSHAGYGYATVGVASAGANLGGPMTLDQATSAANGGPGVVEDNGGGQTQAVGGGDLLNSGNGSKTVYNPLRLFRQMHYMINNEEVERLDEPADCVEVRKYLTQLVDRARAISQLTGWQHFKSANTSEVIQLTDENFRTPSSKLRFIVPLAKIFACIDE